MTSNIFNQYFPNIGNLISNSLECDKNTKKILNFNVIKCCKTIILEPTNETEILKSNHNHKKNCAPGYDGITVKGILLLRNVLTPILVTMINNMFLMGIFPEVFKLGKISPIYKTIGIYKIIG